MKSQLFEIGQEKIENQLDILNIIRTMRKVEALEKLLVPNLQSTYIPLMRDNVIKLCAGGGQEINDTNNQIDDYKVEDRSITIQRCLQMT